MKAHLYRITCLSNLHVGSGDTNYNIIDNEVERDPVLKNVPIIHGSGVKGAFKEHCNSCDMPPDDIMYIFGGEKGIASTGGSKNETSPGNFKFFSANLLTRPLRVSNNAGLMSYALATTPEIIEGFKSLAEGLGYYALGSVAVPNRTAGIAAVKPGVFIEGKNATVLQQTDPTVQLLQKLLGHSNNADVELLAIVDPDFMADCPLPVLARNKLVNGESTNLWYEEIVPHKSVFYSFILVPESAEAERALVSFNTMVAAQGCCVQFGGNATIGEGYCKVEEVTHDE
jgi:CRISPR-associated protein Cmr4